MFLSIEKINDVSPKFLEKKCNPDGQFNMNFNRLLAKAKTEKKVEQKGLNIKDSVHGRNKEMKNEKKNASTYEKIKKEKKNDLDYYMKSYKDGYSKRIGLGKFDCYCENKIFRGIDKMNKLVNTPNMTKSKFKKELRKRYGLRIGLTYFFYFFALAIGIVDLLNKSQLIDEKGFLKYAPNESNKDLYNHLISSLGDVLVYVIPFILTLAIIYILIKIFENVHKIFPLYIQKHIENISMKIFILCVCIYFII
ncbi:variable surface protein [Plasmodium gonderi]|uniref:Variable surface protein n=1 Tax=Plasmodium gonderi TaxID=77519 RepID=A0A1Y1JIF8_PLAGO|nr:variable surface protein [Plasmodium gonderi]GAW82010.1 variable surface protein [Plasmodium gonderi]